MLKILRTSSTDLSLIMLAMVLHVSSNLALDVEIVCGEGKIEEGDGSVDLDELSILILELIAESDVGMLLAVLNVIHC